MLRARDTRAFGKNVAQRLFGLFDSTNLGEMLTLHVHPAERFSRLWSIARSCECARLGSKRQRCFDAAQLSEYHTEHQRKPVVQAVVQKMIFITPVCYWLDSYQNVESVS
mmetsp:Transcript_9781/g.39800  ORF Transcript_9781/g.39800 Transcript_9781/m.39800 type:complete len:110 (-) Transcript_9781:519-848(-)